MMKRILQQLMGGGMPLGGGGGGGGEMGDLPPGLAAMLGGGEGGIDGRRGEQVQGRKGDGYAYVWKIVHALVALALGVYLTCVTAFSGARFSRGADGVQGVGGNGDGGAGVRFFFFWAFATAELGLQSTRFFLERGKVEPGGWMGTIMAVLPQPWKGWLSLVARYSGIFNTVVEDAMVVVFVLGCVAWWGGAVG